MLLQLRMASQAADQLFEDLCGMSRAQFHLLAAVELATRDANSKRGVPQARLVEATGIDRSTLSSTMQRLERRGLLSRKRCKDDGRAYDVKLTAAGIAEWKRAIASCKEVDNHLRRLAVVPEAVLSTLERIATMDGAAA